jgi:protocadherin Fat 4
MVSPNLIFINFSLISSLQVKVTVMDKNDSPPTFRDLPQSYMVSEDLGTGQLVATIKASDPDTIGKLEYSLISGDDGKFLLEKFEGTLKLRDTLDRETKDLYKLVIRVTDGVQYTETTVAIQVSSTLYSCDPLQVKFHVTQAIV